MNNDDALEQLALDTARYFFTVCDRESKGYICKRDMQQLKENELCSLSVDELELVFDSLDQDQNGILTMEEFINGFGTFVKSSHPEILSSIGSSRRSSQLINSVRDQASERDKFSSFLSESGATDFISDNRNVEYIWNALRKENPALLSRFESLLETMTFDVKKMQEQVTKCKSDQKEELNRLCAEMEHHIKQESERRIKEEQNKLKKLQWTMEAEIEKTNIQYQELSQKYATVESQLQDMTYDKERTKALLEKLRKEKEVLAEQKIQLEEELAKSHAESAELSSYLDKVQKEIRDERKRRAAAVWNVNEQASTERESLLRQLDTLRSENMKLLDELDESVANAGHHSGATSPRLRLKKDSSNGLYGSKCPTSDAMLPLNGPSSNIKGEYEFLRGESEEVDKNHLEKTDSGISEVNQGAVVSKNALSIGMPDRIFKVVVAGDSGVGKTSFLDRFCNDRFNSALRSTIGVDFHVKHMKVEDQSIVMQLWDTAGQERFRSITKQYFRKADAVILMFNLASEDSYMNIREWLANIEQMVEPNCAICVVGNKTDLIQDGTVDVRRENIKTDELPPLYFETSAKTGDSVQEAMYQLALVLKDMNSKDEEKGLQLEKTTAVKKSRCCGRRTVA